MTQRTDTSSGVPRGAIPDDEQTVRLLERFRAGDQTALDQLFARYLVPLQRWARGRLPQWAREGTDTQDLVQDTLLRSLKRIDAFEVRGEGAFHAYLRQAVLNRIRNEMRRVSRRPQLSPVDSQQMDDTPSPLERALGTQAMQRYENALSRLRPEERELIVARLELGLSYPEIAAGLGKPTAEAARQAARRALLRLAAEMNVRG